MSFIDDTEAELLKETNAESMEVDLLGVKLVFSAGYSVTISAKAAQNISMVLHSEERRVLNQAREELRRTKVASAG